jgi:hypothetical protein
MVILFPHFDLALFSHYTLTGEDLVDKADVVCHRQIASNQYHQPHSFPLSETCILCLQLQLFIRFSLQHKQPGSLFIS